MTSMPHVVAEAESGDDAVAELANLRSAYQSACNEMIEVRRQRDEAVAYGQDLLARLAEAEEKLAALASVSAPVFAAEPVFVPEPAASEPAAVEPDPVEAVASEPAPAAEPADPIRVAPAQAAPEPVSPIPTILGAPPIEAPVLVEADSSVDETVPSAPEAAAAQPVRWLPPDEAVVSHSSAHEFAALKGLPSESDEDEPTAPVEPLASPMNVLPEVATLPKHSIWRRKVL